MSAATVDHVAYPTRCYRALAPVHLAAACAAQGLVAPSPAGAYQYCEVGCGTGLTLAVLAAANPDARFTGIEHDPGHARQAAALAAECGLENLRVIESDIADFEPLALPAFDYIAAHGVYSWVGQPTRAALRRFIADRLAPGGVAYLSYNALPGWNGALPLRGWLQRRAAALDGPLASRALRARDELLALLREGLPFFTDTPVAAAVAADLQEAEAGYIVHEYLLPGWQALAFEEVHEALGRAGLVYAGDADLPGRALACTRHAACRALARNQDRLGVERELDFLHNRFFRRDLYRRAADAHPPARDALDAVLLTALVPAGTLGAGAPELDPMVLAGLRHLLAERVASYGELRAAAPLCALPESLVRAAVLTLIGTAEMSPCARREPSATVEGDSLARVNRLLLDRFGLLASPLTGTVVAPDAAAMRALSTPHRGPACAAQVARLAASPAGHAAATTRGLSPTVP